MKILPVCAQSAHGLATTILLTAPAFAAKASMKAVLVVKQFQAVLLELISIQTTSGAIIAIALARSARTLQETALLVNMSLMISKAKGVFALPTLLKSKDLAKLLLNALLVSIVLKTILAKLVVISALNAPILLESAQRARMASES